MRFAGDEGCVHLRDGGVLVVDEIDASLHPRFPAVAQLARPARISVAISNPCFEIWRTAQPIDKRCRLAQLIMGES